VVLTSDNLLTASAITFASTVNGAFGLTAAAAVTTFDGTVGSGTALTSLTVTHTADLNGGSVRTTGSQDYQGPVVLTTNDLLTGSAITFHDKVDGTWGLTATGLTTFDGAVGSGAALASLTVNGTADLNGGSVTTSGAQTYNGPVVLTTNDVLTASTITFASTVDGAFGLTAAAAVTRLRLRPRKRRSRVTASWAPLRSRMAPRVGRWTSLFIVRPFERSGWIAVVSQETSQREVARVRARVVEYSKSPK